jgi:hypothetical protein
MHLESAVPPHACHHSLRGSNRRNWGKNIGQKHLMHSGYIDCPLVRYLGYFNFDLSSSTYALSAILITATQLFSIAV